MSWLGCKPVTEINNYMHLLPNKTGVPESATCFSDNHISGITFYSFPKLSESSLLSFALALSLLSCWVLLLPSTIRLLKNVRLSLKNS
jgi:hypothetical protein